MLLHEGHALGYSIKNATPRLFDGAADRNTERHAIRGAMAFDDDAAQTKQCRAVVTAWINSTLECVEHRACDHCGSARQQTALELFPQVGSEHARKPF